MEAHLFLLVSTLSKSPLSYYFWLYPGSSLIVLLPPGKGRRGSLLSGEFGKKNLAYALDSKRPMVV